MVARTPLPNYSRTRARNRTRARAPRRGLRARRQDGDSKGMPHRAASPGHAFYRVAAVGRLRYLGFHPLRRSEAWQSSRTSHRPAVSRPFVFSGARPPRYPVSGFQEEFNVTSPGSARNARPRRNAVSKDASSAAPATAPAVHSRQPPLPRRHKASKAAAPVKTAATGTTQTRDERPRCRLLPAPAPAKAAKNGKARPRARATTRTSRSSRTSAISAACSATWCASRKATRCSTSSKRFVRPP